MVPPLVLIFLVLGTVLIGLATPTEAGAMGVVGALLLALLNRRLSFPVLYAAMEGTAKLTAFVIFILIGSTLFSLVFRGVDGDLWVEGFLTGLPGGEVGFILFVMVLVFLLASSSISLRSPSSSCPFWPSAPRLGHQQALVWPPGGGEPADLLPHPSLRFALFYLRNVAPKEVRTEDIYLGGIPFIGLQLLVLLLTYFLREPILRFVGGG